MTLFFEKVLTLIFKGDIEWSKVINISREESYDK